jgi:hypothetical protein
MGDAFYREDGSTFYGGKGRRPGNFWDEAKALKLFKKDATDKLYRYDPVAEDKQIELEIKAYIAELQSNTRSNCSTCKHFSIPRANWPHKKRQGLCGLKENAEVNKTHLCKSFCRTGEITEVEEFDSLDKKTKSKIKKKEKLQQKRLKVILKKFASSKDLSKEQKKSVEKINTRLSPNLAEKMAVALEKRYEMTLASPAKIQQEKNKRLKSMEANRKAAAEFLGIRYMKKAKVFKVDKEKRATIGGIVSWLRNNKDMQVELEFCIGKGWKITKESKTFGPMII